METYQYALENEQCPKEKRICEHKIEKYHSNNVVVNKLTEFIYLNIFKKNWYFG